MSADERTLEYLRRYARGEISNDEIKQMISQGAETSLDSEQIRAMVEEVEKLTPEQRAQRRAEAKQRLNISEEAESDLQLLIKCYEMATEMAAKNPRMFSGTNDQATRSMLIGIWAQVLEYAEDMTPRQIFETAMLMGMEVGRQWTELRHA